MLEAVGAWSTELQLDQLLKPDWACLSQQGPWFTWQEVTDADIGEPETCEQKASHFQEGDT
jgi:hypothetical protein